VSGEMGGMERREGPVESCAPFEGRVFGLRRVFFCELALAFTSSD
jgi:hypothetical protein